MNDWISVKERLPNENGEWVLVYAGNMNCMMYYHGVFKDMTDARCFNIIDEITHWMPMPKPPNKK